MTWFYYSYLQFIKVPTFGPSSLCVFSMLMSIKKVVTMRAILPGIISAGMRNPMKETVTRSAVGRYKFITKGFRDLCKFILKPVME